MRLRARAFSLMERDRLLVSGRVFTCAAWLTIGKVRHKTKVNLRKDLQMLFIPSLTVSGSATAAEVKMPNRPTVFLV